MSASETPHTPSPSKLKPVDTQPGDDEMYKRRYAALKEMVYELEDENNALAYKAAKLKRAAEMRKDERNRSTLNPPVQIPSHAPPDTHSANNHHPVPTSSENGLVKDEAMDDY